MVVRDLFFRRENNIDGVVSRGKISTRHGTIETPVFMPVGTKATVKALSPDDVKGIGAQIILANTYHLFLRPGPELLDKFGGIGQFMKWNGPILTDSGGFQVQSLSKMVNRQSTNFNYQINNQDLSLAKITEDGVEFKSFIDGSSHFFTPEKAIEIQEQLGADIIMAFDECTPNTNESYTRQAMERTHRWLVRCKKRWQVLENSKFKIQNSKSPQALFGIIQGGRFKKLRRESAKFVVDQNLPGIAIGGESIGSDAEQTAETISWVLDIIPKDKPIYAMGVGVRPSDLISVFRAGADMCDCVAPTKLARSGLLYDPREKTERINIAKAIFAKDKRPIDDDCDCYTCNGGFSRGYLHHLFKSKELLYYRLGSIHNLRVMVRTVEEYRTKSNSKIK